MDFAKQQRNPTRHLMGIGAVILLHVVIIWALLAGLARTVVEVIKGPIDVKVIEEEIKKPPPPPEVVPPPPKLAAPPPPYMPPPEINVPQVQTAPTITAVSQDAPPAPSAPMIQKVPETAAPTAPAVRSAAVACGNYREVMSQITYPREAQLQNLTGEVVIEFTVTPSGQIKDAEIKSSTNRIFNRPSMAAVNQMRCQGQAQDIRVQLPIGFKLN